MRKFKVYSVRPEPSKVLSIHEVLGQFWVPGLQQYVQLCQFVMELGYQFLTTEEFFHEIRSDILTRYGDWLGDVVVAPTVDGSVGCALDGEVGSMDLLQRRPDHLRLPYLAALDLGSELVVVRVLDGRILEEVLVLLRRIHNQCYILLQRVTYNRHQYILADYVDVIPLGGSMVQVKLQLLNCHKRLEVSQFNYLYVFVLCLSPLNLHCMLLQHLVWLQYPGCQPRRLLVAGIIQSGRMSYSSQVNRRHSIFHDPHFKRKAPTLLDPDAPSLNRIQELETTLCSIISEHSQGLMRQIEHNHTTIARLETQLRQCEAKTNLMTQASKDNPPTSRQIQRLIRLQINRRLQSTNSQLSEMEMSIASRPKLDLNPSLTSGEAEKKTQQRIDIELTKIKSGMDLRLNHILQRSSSYQQSTDARLRQVQEDVKASEEAVSSVLQALKGINQKSLLLEKCLYQCMDKEKYLETSLAFQKTSAIGSLHQIQGKTYKVQTLVSHTNRQNQRQNADVQSFQEEMTPTSDLGLSFMDDTPHIQPPLGFQSTSHSLGPFKTTNPPSKDLQSIHQYLAFRNDQFIDLYMNTSMNLQDQIVSPFQQAEYVSKPNSPAITADKDSSFEPYIKLELQGVENRLNENTGKQSFRVQIPDFPSQCEYKRQTKDAHLFGRKGNAIGSSWQAFSKLCSQNVLRQI